MAWGNQWIYKVDGVEINDKTNFYCQIPELSNDPEVAIVTAEVAGDYPVVVRTQPQAGRWTFNIAMKNVTDAQFDTKLATLKAAFTKGARHQLTVQARGMDAPKSTYFWVEGMMVDFRARLVSVRTLVPRPVLS